MNSFRDYLLEELLIRKKNNPAYSQRAFAKFLSVDGSRLSKMLRGERPINAKYAESFGAKLGLSSDDIRGFIEKDLKTSVFKTRKIHRHQSISEQQLQIIYQWRHFAILELIKLPEFKPDIPWIASRLETTIQDIQTCIERLTQVGLLQVSKKGKWIDLSKGYNSYVLGPNQTTQAHRFAQGEIIESAKRALFELPIHQRDQSSMMMACDSKKIAEAKERIRKFRRELAEFLEDSDTKDSVFQLSVSLFPRTPLNHQENL